MKTIHWAIQILGGEWAAACGKATLDKTTFPDRVTCLKCLARLRRKQ